MNLQLTEEQQLLQRSVREFAEAEVKPLAKEIDETGRFPRETFQKAAELGLTGIAMPEEHGGAGMDHVSYDDCDGRDFARLRFDGRDPLGAEFALLRPDSSVRHAKSKKRNFSRRSRAAKKSDATRLPSRKRVRTPRRSQRKPCAKATATS